MRVVVPAVLALALLAPSAASADFIHTVMPGESLYSIAAADGLSVDQLAAANGISPMTELVAGQSLAIPPQTAVFDTGAGEATVVSAPATESTGYAAPVSGSYLVQPGDTLWGLAERAGTTVDALAAANGLSPDAYLIAGTTIRLTGASDAAEPLSMVTTSTEEPEGAVAEGDPAAPPYPTPERLGAGEIGQIGADNGATSALTDAIAWQESGFNNDLVSSADARGIMQILPGTWYWIQHSLDTGAPLAPASATDNVRGGAIMLSWLLRQTGGDPAMAAAGYYQGLTSVEIHGLYPSTQQYVADVMALRNQFGG